MITAIKRASHLDSVLTQHPQLSKKITEILTLPKPAQQMVTEAREKLMQELGETETAHSNKEVYEDKYDNTLSLVKSRAKALDVILDHELEHAPELRFGNDALAGLKAFSTEVQKLVTEIKALGYEKLLNEFISALGMFENMQGNMESKEITHNYEKTQDFHSYGTDGVVLQTLYYAAKRVARYHFPELTAELLAWNDEKPSQNTSESEVNQENETTSA